MYLTRLFLNPVHRDVHKCMEDSHALHVRVLSLFGDSEQGRANLGVLHRLEVNEQTGTVVLLVQSATAPRRDALPAGFLDPRAAADAWSSTPLEPFFDRLTTGAAFRFRLRANATRRIDTKTGPDGKRRNGRRVPLRRDDVLRAWIVRKLADAGLEPAGEVRIRPDGAPRGNRAGKRVTHEAHVFEGVAIVRDGARARDAVQRGVGPAKAYGCGLLSLAPSPH